MRHEDAERRCPQIECERDYYKQLSDIRAAERNAAHKSTTPLLAQGI